jgi:uncharacterized protein YjbI with pentapeptide repeats
VHRYALSRRASVTGLLKGNGVDMVQYREFKFDGASISHSAIKDIQFRFSSFVETAIETTTLRNVRFIESDMRGVLIYSVELNDVKFGWTDLAGAQFDPAVLVSKVLIQASNLGGVSFCGYLRECDGPPQNFSFLNAWYWKDQPPVGLFEMNSNVVLTDGCPQYEAPTDCDRKVVVNTEGVDVNDWP